MTDPLYERDEVAQTLRIAAEEAQRYLSDIDSHPVADRGTEETIRGWADPMPEEGQGGLAAVRELAERGQRAATRSSGPRFFHFVMGGGTPAALGADWLASTYDQVAFGWASSPMAARLEQVAVDWLRQLFELPEEFGGVLTSGATMGNFVALATARSWWADEHGVDVDGAGMSSSLPAPPILSSGYIHPSAVQAIGMLGMGQRNIERFARDAAGRLDTDALEARLRELDGPAILVANAGEVNAGDFDPIDRMADLASEHGAWLHVDGAFGLFARLAPTVRPLAAGVERADSVISDGHKWLNVPYDCGFAFVRDTARLSRTFNVGAPYLPAPDDPRPNPGFLAPENSRRARALAVWATLRAYGRTGYREMVERHISLASHLAERIDAEPHLERLAEAQLNIVCFRARPEGVAEEELDALNGDLGEALLRDGRVFAGTTTYEGKVAFRPAIVNWRTQAEDVDLLVDVLLELLEERLGSA
jgi:glutamate/tyrosine decarboxylase-like PLP-dependent enzyme